MDKKILDSYKALYQIATEIDSGTSTKDVLNAIVRSTTLIMNVKGCSLMLLTQGRSKLVHIVAYGLSESYIKKGTIKIDPVIDEVLKGSPVIVEDVCADSRIQYKEQARKEGIVSMLSIPMVLKDEVTGLLRLYTKKPRHFSENDIEFLKLVASLGAISLRKATEYESQEQYYEKKLKEKIAQLDRSQEELAKVEEAKEKLLAFISMVAHDLKAPLAAIQTYFGVMLGGFTGELNPKHQEIIEKSSRRVDGLLELISDLLDISRIESGQIVHEMKPVSIGELVQSQVDDAAGLAKKKKISFSVNIPPDLPPIYGSPTRLQQVFSNLLSNAVKFTPEGGLIDFVVVHQEGCIYGTLQDTGIGIPPDELPRIFEDFYRASNVESLTGTGLGLPIVRRIIESHGGEIEVVSPCPETGKGCRFVFSIPISKP